MNKKAKEFVSDEIEKAEELNWEFQHKLAQKTIKKFGGSYKKILPYIMRECYSDSIDAVIIEENLEWFKSKPFRIDATSWLHNDPSEKKYCKLINKNLTKK